MNGEHKPNGWQAFLRHPIVVGAVAWLVGQGIAILMLNPRIASLEDWREDAKVHIAPTWAVNAVREEMLKNTSRIDKLEAQANKLDGKVDVIIEKVSRTEENVRELKDRK